MDVLESGRTGWFKVGRRVSWGIVLAGTLMTLATMAVVWLLGLGLTLLGTDSRNPLGGLVALVVLAIAAPIVGGALGGYVAGYLTTGRRLLGELHGLLGSAFAFLITTLFSMRLFGATLATLGNTVATTAAAGAQVGGGAAASGGSVASSADRLLQSLGYSAAQARRMVIDAQASIQSALHSGAAGSGDMAAQAQDAANSLMRYLGASICIFIGVWLLSMLLAWITGRAGNERFQVTDERLAVDEEPGFARPTPREQPPSPLQPQPTT